MIVLKWEELHLHDCRWWELLLVDIVAKRTYSSGVCLCTVKKGKQKMVGWFSECPTGRNIRITDLVLCMVCSVGRIVQSG
jgi:hypothetical protein